MTAPLLTVENLHKRYQEHYAVKGVSFEVESGMVFGLLGGNGAGKTTTMRIINRILAADEGDVRVMGQVLEDHELRQRIGYLPEERGLYPRMGVLDTAVFFGRMRGLSKSAATLASEKLLKQLELWDWRERRVHQLSKGMQQKLQYIVAVIHDPELVILDEPWSGLDPINAATIKSLVEERRNQGKSVLFSTHQLESAERLCDRVCIIADGQVVANGTVPEIIASSSKGPRLIVRGADPDDASALKEFLQPFATEVEFVGDDVRATFEGDTSAWQIVSRLEQSEIALARLVVQEPSLEETFVELVGQPK